MAANGHDQKTRALPSQGLDTAQMARAIRSVGLEPLLVPVEDDEYWLKGVLRAYLRDGIPVLMGIDLYDASGTSIGPHVLPHGKM